VNALSAESKRGRSVCFYTCEQYTKHVHIAVVFKSKFYSVEISDFMLEHLIHAEQNLLSIFQRSLQMHFTLNLKIREDVRIVITSALLTKLTSIFVIRSVCTSRWLAISCAAIRVSRISNTKNACKNTNAF
jgi:hypothetical protein